MTTPNTASSLKVLSQDKEHGVTRSESFRVDPDEIIFEEGFNVRTQDDMLEAHIDRLHLAMKAGAYVPPIDVRVEAGKIICVEGHCRAIAGRRIKKDDPEYKLEARNFRGNDIDRVLHMLGTGSGQKPLSPLEQGIAFLRLTRMGKTPQEIAAKLGITDVTVRNQLALAETPAEVQDLVRSGDVSSTLAREVSQQGPEAIEALKAEVAKERAKPAPKKGKKKKKVTAKKLAGTAAAKPKKGKKKKAADPEKIGDDEIRVTLTRAHAQEAVDFLKTNAPENAVPINNIISALEMALL